MSTQATNFNGSDWNLVNGEWIFVGTTPEITPEESARETAQDRATFFDLDR